VNKGAEVSSREIPTLPPTRHIPNTPDATARSVDARSGAAAAAPGADTAEFVTAEVVTADVVTPEIVSVTQPTLPPQWFGE
jgi:hypothetical protein